MAQRSQFALLVEPRLLPFVLFSAAAGQLADKYDKAALIHSVFRLEKEGLVAIFPEGRITDTGEFYPFRPGIARILQATPVPVVPMALRGDWR